MLVALEVIIGANTIRTEVFSDIRDAQKFRNELKQKYGDKYDVHEMMQYINESFDDKLLNWY